MQRVALGWLVLELTDSAFAVGLVSAAGTLPVLLFTLWGGSLANRVNRLRVVTVLQGFMLLDALALAWLTWSGRATLTWLIVLALAHGVFVAFEIPARQTLTMDLVGRDDLMNALALNSMTFNVTRVVGPALAGGLMAVVGPALVFFLNAVSYLAVLGGLLMVRLDPALVVASTARRSYRDAFRFILAPGWPQILVILTTTYTIFAISFLSVLPVYARDALGTGEVGYGMLMSAFGAGAAGGALLQAAMGPRSIGGGAALMAGLVVGSALLMVSRAPSLGFAVIVLALAGSALATNAITTNTMLQTEAPDEIRGHVIGLYAFIVVGLAPLGAMVAGSLSEVFGVRTEAAVAGFVCLLVTFLMTVRRRRMGLK
jgi:MFS family permease